ncbi:MAG: hypothetical protein AAF432_02345 [Planctomycetota bacterium]
MTTARRLFAAAACLVLLAGLFGPTANAQDVRQLLRQLNDDDTVKGSDTNKSYKLIFDAYLQLDPPPMPIDEFFNATTIHAQMADWDEVAAWAESGPTMVEALLEARERGIFGLPYGQNNVSREYREGGLYADVAVDGALGVSSYPWLDAIDVVSAFAVAEIYRLMEADKPEDAFELLSGINILLRQCSDRIFFDEKTHCIERLIESLSVQRDIAYTYRDAIPVDTLTKASIRDIPFLNPGRRYLFIPEGDRIVAEALLRELIDERDGPDPDKFAAAFANIQSRTAPLTRFGAVKRWKMIADVHGSLEASLDRLTLIYDDWYRRWQVQAYDPILDIDTQFERTNPVRYSAVIYSMQDLQTCFDLRTRLIMEVNGTAVALGVAAYRKYFDSYPDNKEKCYGQFLRGRVNDIDPFDFEWDTFRYTQVNSSRGMAIDTEFGRLDIERDDGVLWSVGFDHADGRCDETTTDGTNGDVLLWPPVRAVSREQGLLD